MSIVKEFVAHYNTTHTTAEGANKEEFTQVKELLKNKKKRAEVAKELKKVSEDAIKLDSMRREFKKLVNNVVAYYNIPPHSVNYTEVNYDNLKRVIKLSKYVEKHYDSDYRKLSPLTTVWEKGMSSYRYNNGLEQAAKELVDSLRVTKKETPDQAYKYLDRCSHEAKVALLDKLKEELGE